MRRGLALTGRTASRLVCCMARLRENQRISMRTYRLRERVETEREQHPKTGRSCRQCRLDAPSTIMTDER